MPFAPSEDGVAAGEGVECPTPGAAVLRAQALASKPEYVGAVAFGRSGDPTTGNFDDAVLIKAFGDVPKDLSGL